MYNVLNEKCSWAIYMVLVYLATGWAQHVKLLLFCGFRLPLSFAKDIVGVCGLDSEPECVRPHLLNSRSSCRGRELTLELQKPCLPDTPVFRLLFGCSFYSSHISSWAVSQIALDRELESHEDVVQEWTRGSLTLLTPIGRLCWRTVRLSESQWCILLEPLYCCTNLNNLFWFPKSLIWAFRMKEQGCKGSSVQIILKLIKWSSLFIVFFLSFYSHQWLFTTCSFVASAQRTRWFNASTFFFHCASYFPWERSGDFLASCSF